jgi:hypothetical protein
MSGGGVRGIDLFKIAGESISGWIPSWKTGEIRPTRQPFCSLMEERLLLYLEYHPQVAWYGRGDISSTFASTYKITTPLPTPYTIDYLFEGNAHVYLPDAIGQLQGGFLLIAEAGLEREKRRERNQAKAEAARKVADDLGGVYWIGTEATLLPQRHANLVFLHARRQPFPSFQELAEALQVVWPYGEAACVEARGRAFGRTVVTCGKRGCCLENVCRCRRLWALAGRFGEYPTDPTDSVNLSCSRLPSNSSRSSPLRSGKQRHAG